MGSIARISTDSISLLAPYKAVNIFMSSVMEVFKNEFSTAEWPSYKEVLYYEAIEDWYAQRDLDEAERKERNCTRQAPQFFLVTK